MSNFQSMNGKSFFTWFQCKMEGVGTSPIDLMIPAIQLELIRTAPLRVKLYRLTL